MERYPFLNNIKIVIVLIAILLLTRCFSKFLHLFCINLPVSIDQCGELMDKLRERTIIERYDSKLVKSDGYNQDSNLRHVVKHRPGADTYTD